MADYMVLKVTTKFEKSLQMSSVIRMGTKEKRVEMTRDQSKHQDKKTEHLKEEAQKKRVRNYKHCAKS